MRRRLGLRLRRRRGLRKFRAALWTLVIVVAISLGLLASSMPPRKPNPSSQQATPSAEIESQQSSVQ